MDRNLVDSGPECNRQRVPINIIIGCHRVRATDWLDVIGMVINGTGLIREATGFRLIHSGAFEQEARS